MNVSSPWLRLLSRLHRLRPLRFGLFFLLPAFLACGVPSQKENEAPLTPRLEGAFMLEPPGEGGQYTSDTFYDFPFPHALRLDTDQTPNLKGFPNPKRVTQCPLPPSTEPLVTNLLRSYDPDAFLANIVKIADQQAKGFSLNPTIFFRFRLPLLQASLPPPDASLLPESPVYLVDIDPTSPEYTRRIPVQSRADLKSRFLPSGILALRPYDGFALRPKTLYAAVVLRSARDSQGFPLPSLPRLDLLAGRSAAKGDWETKLQEAYKPFFAFLTSQKGEESNLAAVTVFRAGDPLQEQKDLYSFVQALPAPAPPSKLECEDTSSATPYILCKGIYSSPIFQKGTPPFLSEQDGFFTYDDKGKPIFTMNDLRFALTIPKRFLADGSLRDRPIPLVLYAHGTGGDYQSFISDRTARRLAEIGIAGLGIDQVVHGTRTVKLGDISLDFLFFNALNLPAARDNIRQSAIDYYWQIRLFKTLRFAHRGHNLAIDPERVWFMGHSQGGLIGPPFLAMEQNIRAAYLSAPGGLLVNTLIHKTEPKDPVEIPAVIRYLICDPDLGLSTFHPIFSVLQNFFDPADPVNYAREILAPSHAPINLYLSKGLTDNYAPPAVFDPLVTAMRLPFLGHPKDQLPGLRLRSLPVFSFPVQGNFTHPSGVKTTVGFSQHEQCLYPSGGSCDGHFVAFYNPDTIRHWVTFFQSLLTSPTAQIH